jgi:hypothetical protein
MLASFFEGKDPEDILITAVERFRAITATTLADHSELILDGGTLDGQRAAEELHNLSAPCVLAECDFFWSHSWRDDKELKWEAITRFCMEFQLAKGRPPKLWLDKVCIDQANIAQDLSCLPVFLAGCNELLVTSGISYTSRLWCCVELYVYFSMRLEDQQRSQPRVLLLAHGQDAHMEVSRSWIQFDSLKCDCFDPNDKVRIMSVIETYPGGTAAFNLYIQTLAKQLLGELYADASPEDTMQSQHSLGRTEEATTLEGLCTLDEEYSCMTMV